MPTPSSKRLSAAADDRVVERIWSRDGTLWAPEGTPELADRLGWLDIADRLRAQVDDYIAFADEVRDAGYTDAVLLGMGGSSLAPEVFRRSFEGRQRPDAARARLDAPHAGEGGARRGRPRHRDHDRQLEVGRHDRAELDVQGVPRAPAGRRPLRRGDRSRLLAREAGGRARVPPGLPRRSRDRRPLQRAVAVRARPRRARGDRHRRRAGLRDRRGARSAAPSTATPA